MVERFNQTLKTILETYIANRQDGEFDWTLWLPDALYASRIGVQSSTNMSPYKILYGKDMPLPAVLTQLRKKDGSESSKLSADFSSVEAVLQSSIENLEDEVFQLRRAAKQAMEAVARANIRAAQCQQRYTYAIKHRSLPPPRKDGIGSLVRIRQTTSSFARKTKGPFRIVGWANSSKTVARLKDATRPGAGEILRHITHVAPMPPLSNEFVDDDVEAAEIACSNSGSDEEELDFGIPPMDGPAGPAEDE